MLFITGDTHGIHDIEKLYSFADKIRTKQYYNEIEPEEEIFVIIAGDFGFIWRPVIENNKIPDTLINIKDMRNIHHVFDQFPFTTLFVDGNHENFDVINALPVTTKWGGKVQQVTNKVYHLMRGETYTIDGKTVLTIGGGLSVDRRYRTEGHSWWPQEELADAELDKALQNLKTINNKVDVVVTHTAPQDVVKELDVHLPPWQYRVWGMKLDDPTSVKLNRVLDVVDATKWYFAHFHLDKNIKLPESHAKHDIDFQVLYQDVVEV